MGMAHKKIIIGVTAPDKGERFLWWSTRLAIWLAGGKARKITAKHHQPFENYDGFVISGGSDINPEIYGETSISPAKPYDDARDALEQEVIRHALEAQKPILAICRGMQMLNITMGGSLYQEAKEVLEDFLPNESLFSKLIGRRVVEVDESSQLFNILGGYNTYLANSIHHQAVKDVAPGMKVVAKEKNYLVQAIEPKDKTHAPYIIGVQWHPELMLYVNSARSLFRALVEASKEK